MSEGLTIDINRIAENITSYIDQGNFFDIFDIEDINKILEKTTLNSTDFNKLLSEGKSKYNSSDLYSCSHKCNVSVNSFEDAIEILKTYKNELKLESSQNIIDFFEKYETEMNHMRNEISELIHEKILELSESEDFEKIYNFLKDLSERGTKEQIDLSISTKLSEKQNSDGQTPLLHACVNGDFELVKSLIEGGCDRDAVSKQGKNCLLLASNHGHLEIVKYLIESGIDKNWHKTNGYNAIHSASQNGHLEIIKYLQSIGCDIKLKTNNNRNCVYFASLNGHLETVQYLVSCGVNPHKKMLMDILP
ncbi:hypothetical protein TVAG_392530 [Trichomonas vaginalis G3]|uniref:Uncharacterized protein n=1 Tax=Trichomonas vaginalis (strain ATCC PRA-98 / G3) TaxID=412133 RepID=A2DWV4_TRIV3|nr:histone-lysine N-methyltransferase family [Trichomonas vaginalis G3]EAY15136.1 hypothetical protein TVAG_392530 [Trichomonas vaginalis G3]KAI5499172.1 histone-lysine N-methyltransferase family [Trichomonas vaginalis G3]|eukprot:XP_001327359.1 hypothetical protein [Trichomonas vaginalis G3]